MRLIPPDEQVVLHESNAPVERVRSGASAARSDDRGLAIVMVAVTMLVLLAFVGLAVDVGMLYNERRQSQSAADTAALAAVQDLTWNAQVDTVFKVVNASGDTQFTEADWNDPLRCPASGELPVGFAPQAQTSTTRGSGVTLSATNCIAKSGTIGEDDYQLFVRLPSVEVEATFSALVGVNSFESSAFAIAGFGEVFNPSDDVLPLQVTSMPTGDASAACLVEPPGGLGGVICTGPNQGNFATARIWRPTELLCSTASHKVNMARRNTAMGLDHNLSPYPAPDPDDIYGSDPANGPEAILETCPNATLRPNQIETDTGAAISAAVAEGLLMTPGNSYIPDLLGGRLHRYPTTVGWWQTAAIKGASGLQVDNNPLWSFIGTAGETFGGEWVTPQLLNFNNPLDPTNMNPSHPVASPGWNDATKAWDLQGATLPEICDPGLATFSEVFEPDPVGAPGVTVVRNWPWSFNRMAHCIYAIDQSGSGTIVFDKKTIDPTPVSSGGLYDIEYSPRFGWVPESWRDMAVYQMGGSKPFEIKRFRPLFVNDLFFPHSGDNQCVWRAGETGQAGNNGGIRFPDPNRITTPNPCTNAAGFNAMTALLFDVEFGGQPPTMLPQEVLDKEPALKKKPQPTLIK